MSKRVSFSPLNLLISGANSAISDARLAANVTVRRKGRPRKGTSGAMSTRASSGTRVLITPPVGHGVSGNPVTGGMGSYNAYYNTAVTPAQINVVHQSDYNSFPNTAVAAPNSLLEQVMGNDNYSPLRPIALNFNDNDFSGQPRGGTPVVIDPTGDYMRNRAFGYAMANQQAHDTYTVMEEGAGGGAWGAVTSTPHEIRQQEAHQSGSVSGSYQGQRLGDGLHSGDPTISHYITGLGGIENPQVFHHVIDIGDPDHHVIDIKDPDHHVIDIRMEDDETTPVNQYIEPTDPIHTGHQTSQLETNIRHGQENGTTNAISQIADQVQTPQGNNRHQYIEGVNTPMAPVTNNSGSGTHPSMVGPSGAPMPSSADEAYRLIIQGEPSLLDLAPAADIPVMPGQPTILGVKTSWANPQYNKYVGPVYA